MTNYISKAIYYFSEKEIGAKVTQTYYELIRQKTVRPKRDKKTGSIDQKDLMDKLKKTTHWSSLQGYIFNLDTLYDLIKHGHTVVMIEDGKRVKMRFTDEDLKNILLEVDKAIDSKEEAEEKMINKRKVEVPNRPTIPKVDKRTEIFSKYNLKTENPRSIFLKLLKYFDEQIESFRRRILRLAVDLPLEYPDATKVVKKGTKTFAVKPKPTEEEEAPESTVPAPELTDAPAPPPEVVEDEAEDKEENKDK